MKKDFG